MTIVLLDVISWRQSAEAQTLLYPEPRRLKKLGLARETLSLCNIGFRAKGQ